MTSFVFVLVYLAAAVFLAASIVRVLRYARAPVHLRWELYPVPHEEPRRAAHGGSYFEEADWWTKPTRFNLLGEMKVMLPEILFLKGLWEFNRPLWFRSFPFHFGLYLLIGAGGLVMVAVALSLIVPELATSVLGEVVRYLYAAFGAAGTVLAVAGAAGLLVLRLTDKQLRIYTTRADIFNLAFFIATLGTLALWVVTRGPASPDVLTVATALLAFNTRTPISNSLAVGLTLGALLVAYIPMTHMSHFIAKYFTYHSVRWDDQPTFGRKNLEAKIAEYLTYRPTWSAPHVGADGSKTWVEIASANPAQGVRK